MIESILLGARPCLDQHVVDSGPPCLPVERVGVPPELDPFEKRFHVYECLMPPRCLISTWL